MVNIEKHVVHWLTGAEEDFQVATELVDSGRVRHGLFFLHLSLEKLLKAQVCQKTKDLAPPIHNLPRLARLAHLVLEPGHSKLLAEINSFNIEGRYPELFLPLPTKDEVKKYLMKTKDIEEWLKNQF